MLKLIFKRLMLILFLLFSVRGMAQDIEISGVIKDVNSNEAIGGSTIKLKNSKRSAVADKYGKFKLAVPQQMKNRKILISYLGYKPDSISIDTNKKYYEILLDTKSDALSEVVVTGVSRATLVKENPVPIVSVSKKKIEQSSESNIIDVLVRNVPGLNAVKTGPNISKPFIRGLGYNRVLTLYDGIRQEGQQWGDEHGIEVDAYNIERSEVIKGPASLMYGSDALAGVVSLMSAMPGIDDGLLHGKALSEYQSNNGLIGNGIGLFYSKNHWSFALRGSYRIAKNYSNAIDGRVYNTGFRETNASGTVRYQTIRGSSTFNLTLYDNIQGIPDGSRDSLTRKFTHQIYEGDLDDIKNRPVVSDALLNSYTLSPLHQHIQHYRIYNNNHYALGEGDIDVMLAFQQNVRREYNHPTMPEQAGMFVRLNTLNYGVKYNTPKILNTEFTFGINGMYQNNLNKNATDFPIPDYSLFDAGAYLFAKWKYERWTIGGGVRSDLRYLKANDFYTSTNAQTGFGQHVSPAEDPKANLQFPSFNKSFGGISLSLGTTYQLSDQVSLKANVARGYRAPSITEFASNGLDPGAHIIYLGNRDFKPEFSLQEDIGADITLKDFSMSFSVFNNNIQNYIYLSQLLDAAGNPVISAQGDRTYQYQQSSAQLYGFEATFNLHPEAWKGFSFDNSFAVIHGFNRKAIFKDKKTDGEYLPLIPPVRLLTSISQDLKLNSKLVPAMNFRAEGEFNGAQNRYLALNDTETATSSYLLFNVAAGATINYSKKHTLQVQAQVSNLFNETYQSNLSRLKYFEYNEQSSNGYRGIQGMGRNIGLKIICSF
ncbi:TonB-dependent receptor [Pedobacter cryoconitis]|uniref:Iron complex outermembrane receptor protein n=1 Tax=Pedobacter cryoconitis TaxID=188932 RepID=A0A327SCS1_9SPHI|nr:TonB-dependent receptor [Pedobacter cryoconitis]RAJ26162.1 iron complex outermembrane receptor protein [Pedobacter cryoconitis]